MSSSFDLDKLRDAKSNRGQVESVSNLAKGR